LNLPTRVGQHELDMRRLLYSIAPTQFIILNAVYICDGKISFKGFTPSVHIGA